jgi:hypothetical protein
VITLDRTGDGCGWFIDPTPGDSSEFAPGAVNSPAQGRIDLLSVVAHEMGHMLGYGEDDSDTVTGEYLAPGVRHVPVAALPPSGLTSTDPAAVIALRPNDSALIKPTPSSVGRPSVVSPPASSAAETAGVSGRYMVLDPTLLSRPGSGGSETARTASPRGSVRGPGLTITAFPTSGGSRMPILDASSVDALLADPGIARFLSTSDSRNLPTKKDKHVSLSGS